MYNIDNEEEVFVMAKYGIVLDSTIYMPQEVIKEKNIQVVSLNVSIENGETYKETDITREFVIKKRSEGAQFKTSAPGPGLYHETFEKMLQTYDHVFVQTMSKELSGSYQSSLVGSKMLDDPSKVTIFDTNHSAYGNEMLVYELIEMIEADKTVEEITTRMHTIIKQSKLMFTCENLFSLVAGGRLSTAKAMIGTILRMKPIIDMIDGKLILMKTERTYKKVFSIIEQKIKETSKGFKNITFYITATNSQKSGDALKAYIEDLYPNSKIRYTDLLGPVLTVHVGDKGFGISWFYE